MRPRYDFAPIVALASAAAVLTALSDYALSMEKSLDAVSLRMVAAFFITLLALVAARRLGSASTTEGREAPAQQHRERLLISAPNHQRHASVDPLVLKRLGEEISACNPIVFTLCDHVQDVVANTEAAGRVATDATAFPQRSSHFVMNVHARWREQEQDRPCIEWARGIFEATKPYAVGTAYINFMPEDELDRVESAYGGNYKRLVEVKRRYDPQNLFRMNQNVRPMAEA